MERPTGKAAYDDADVGKNVIRDETIDEPGIENVNILESDNVTLDNDGNDKNAKLYNSRALHKNASTYELETFEKKALIIFNHRHFEGMKTPRLGTELDVKALKDTFKKFGFHVDERPDLTKKEVLKELETFSETDFTDYGCVAVAVLTHGKQDMLRARDRCYYSEEEILQYFNVKKKPTLATKPRILIVQACRGEHSTNGVKVKQTIYAYDDSDDNNYFIPKDADILILRSSYRGQHSFRHTSKGSWFIQSLCKKVDELAATHDLISIATEVQREVAVDKGVPKYNEKTFKLENITQMPVFTSTLMRKLYLRKHGDAAPQILAESSYTFNYIRFLDWMSSTETSLQSAKHSKDDLLRLSLQVEEFRCYLDNQTPREGTMLTEDILTRNNKRFVAITELVRALSKKVTRAPPPATHSAPPATSAAAGPAEQLAARVETVRTAHVERLAAALVK